MWHYKISYVDWVWLNMSRNHIRFITFRRMLKRITRAECDSALVYNRRKRNNNTSRKSCTNWVEYLMCVFKQIEIAGYRVKQESQFVTLQSWWTTRVQQSWSCFVIMTKVECSWCDLLSGLGAFFYSKLKRWNADACPRRINFGRSYKTLRALRRRLTR